MMTYFPASLFVETERWIERPPTGRELAAKLETHFSSEIYVGELSRLSGRSGDSVTWHLRQNAVVPAGLLAAALRFRKQSVVAA